MIMFMILKASHINKKNSSLKFFEAKASVKFDVLLGTAADPELCYGYVFSVKLIKFK